ncbi:glycoside hydrolase family 43 protein [Aestuariibaculum sp. M13]|uniref:glycoside hydrolase family 43 protein n=1 Tax=Aestuariibaculum sp. M13 TaxID=2967132 RepID=UPI002159CAE5|nr:glycoside hydrolase family 43 protein [Aestuariibaculum sp. M13]MCR8668681.1 glycoside hydrolase family 43 protein [Aestuariibaculum sp. M13]
MKHFIYIILLSFTLTGFAQHTNLFLADPTIFEHDGTYYAYGTKENDKIKGEGFLVYTSTDLKHWEGPKGATDGFAFKKGDGYGTWGFWAPQIFEYNGKFHMAYTANEHIAIATSDSPLGPFKNDGSKIDSEVKQIDPFIFFDNGKVYLYHVRLENGNRIFVAEMTKDLKSIKPNTLQECIHATQLWEDTVKAEWTVTEGPTVIKRKNTYFLIYSANDFRNKDYAVGYAISNNPSGPWKKKENSPIISRKLLNYPGTGHGDVFYDTKGKLNYVFHTHNSELEVGPRKTASVTLNLRGKKLTISKNKTINWLEI